MVNYNIINILKYIKIYYKSILFLTTFFNQLKK